MILLIDNYDSFTYNLYQYLGELGKEVMVRRNDQIKVEEILKLKPEAIVLSPGPGYPEDAGGCIDIIKAFYQSIPILGICLGHQAIGAAFDATIKPAEQMKHGKTSSIKHKGEGLFEYISLPIEVMRYHSLVIEENTLPAPFDVTATAMDDGELMAIQHRKYPLYGLQFHPESIGTGTGKRILGNFIKKTEAAAL
ncbi:anthranilate synthase component 2/anthranilate synthase/phosphoribosyltransferase [Salinibacillus kushneri]|uniref:Anthranilate synthase component 2/anthranilate synthase/phosphoribosyltransferase n=1 Tax=Salinibacillus kushneri TaxID=237682 RepID=A0A1I0GJ38_9BACI|nr:aminodeoxychorismate/anthranilate synthase component II [Salinibacillus kushneri]SET70953.1 anthranilate synthase component 2/anthranilate synthase/phosphoribosyltransferase [Salinibacillus kushneri]